MNSLAIGCISAACMFGGALLGFALRAALPEHHLQGDAKDTVKLGAGMVTTMAALVLGLLVSSAKGSFDSINSGFTQVAAQIMQLDRTLAQYGPGAQEVRAQLRTNIADSIEMLWPSDGSDAVLVAEQSNRMELLQVRLRTLKPETEAQSALLIQAQNVATQMAQTRWLMIEQTQNHLPIPLLVVLVFWLSLLFTSFGLYAPRNATILIVLLLCAISVAGAIFLIFALNRPLEGPIKVSSGPMRNALEHLGK